MNLPPFIKGNHSSILGNVSILVTVTSDLIIPGLATNGTAKIRCRGLIVRYFTALLLPASVAQLDAPSDWRPGGRGFNPRRGRQHSFVEIDHEIFSTVILSLPLIQEGQLSVFGERMCTILVNRLED